MDPVLYDTTTLMAVGIVSGYAGFCLGALCMALLWVRERRRAAPLRVAA